MSKCKCPRNETKIIINRIKYVEARKHFNLDRQTKEALFQFRLDYIEEEVDNLDYESKNGTEREKDEETKDDTNIVKIQHILTENQTRHLESMDEIMGF